MGPRNHVFDEVQILPQKGQFGEICADPLPVKIQRDAMWRYVPLQRSVRQRPLLRNFNIYSQLCGGTVHNCPEALSLAYL